MVNTILCHGRPVSQVVTDLEEIVHMLLAHQPSATILLAKVCLSLSRSISLSISLSLARALYISLYLSLSLSLSMYIYLSLYLFLSLARDLPPLSLTLSLSHTLDPPEQSL